MRQTLKSSPERCVFDLQKKYDGCHYWRKNCLPGLPEHLNSSAFLWVLIAHSLVYCVILWDH